MSNAVGVADPQLPLDSFVDQSPTQHRSPPHPLGLSRPLQLGNLKDIPLADTSPIYSAETVRSRVIAASSATPKAVRLRRLSIASPTNRSRRFHNRNTNTNMNHTSNNKLISSWGVSLNKVDLSLTSNEQQASTHKSNPNNNHASTSPSPLSPPTPLLLFLIDRCSDPLLQLWTRQN